MAIPGTALFGAQGAKMLSKAAGSIISAFADSETDKRNIEATFEKIGDVAAAVTLISLAPIDPAGAAIAAFINGDGDPSSMV